ncbi:MAG: SelL-related redox protein [Pirellulaceae bacterium]
MTVCQVTRAAPRWMRHVLQLAGLYNLVWSIWIVLFPTAVFRWSGIDLPRYPQIWQFVGVIVGVYGLGYWLASSSPYRYWSIVLVGLLGKILGPLAFVAVMLQREFSWSWAMMILLNDVIWWVPLGAILYEAARAHMDASRGGPSLEWKQAMREARSHRGATLAELSEERPTLVVFLRHTGCTFCREALADLNRCRAAIEAEGVRLAIVHMSEALTATMRFEEHDLGDVHRYSDRECELYRAFGLERGRFLQLFGMKVWCRGVVAALWCGHGIGRLEGDGFRLPGVFLLDQGQILAEFRATTAADRPDYVRIARQVRPPLAGSQRSSGAAPITVPD